MKISTLTDIRLLKLAALFCLCAIFAPPSAYAQAIKMLPPTNCPNVTVGPTQANVWGVLGWDSKSPLSCIPNFTFANNGYTGLGSQVSPQALLDLFGDYNYSYPSPGTGLPLGNAHLQPLDSANPSSTAITFGATPTGAVNAQGVNEYDGYAEAGIYVQYQLSNPTYPNGATKMYFGTTNNYLTGPQIHLAIDNLGNVGIGTTIPAAPLDVNGGMRGSNSAVVLKGACSPEGMLGYDMTNHEPVYCSSSNLWTNNFSRVGQVVYQYDSACHTNTVGGYEDVTTVTITPGSDSDNVLIHVDTNTNAAVGSGTVTRFSLARTVGGVTTYFWQNPSLYSVQAAWPTNNGYVENSLEYINLPVSFSYLDSPNTTSPVTYHLEYMDVGYQSFVNCGVLPAPATLYSTTSVTATEVMP